MPEAIITPLDSRHEKRSKTRELSEFKIKIATFYWRAIISLIEFSYPFI